MSWLFTWFRSRFTTLVVDHHDHDHNHITIEKFFMRQDVYRITTGDDPRPLPTIKSPVQDIYYQQAFDDLRSEIQKIVDSHVTEEHRINLFEVTKPDYPHGDGKRVTLIIDIDQSSGPSTRWFSMMDALKLLLKSTKLEPIEIELVDENRASVPQIYPEAVQSESIMFYESVRSKLIAFLLEQLPDVCHGMSLFKFGSTWKTAVPSVVIFVEPFSQQNWESLTSQLRLLLSSNDHIGMLEQESSTSLRIEFMPGRISQLTGQDFRRNQDSSDLYPTMGCSLCPRGSGLTGTSGGFLNLKIGNRVHKGLLTCHHVIAHGVPDQYTESVAKNGYRYKAETAPRPLIQYPSSEDLKWTRENIKEDAKEHSTRIEKLKLDIESKELAQAGSTRSLKKQLQWEINLLESSERALQRLDDLPQEMGPVLVSSGSAINAQKWSILDWAFVEIPNEKKTFGPHFPAINELPHHNESPLQTGLYKKNLRYTGPAPGEKVFVAQGFGKLEKGEWYFKRGRSTGLTVGMCNGTELVKFEPANCQRYTLDGQVHDVRAKPTYEHVILSFPDHDEPIDVVGNHQEFFAKAGDSGSLIINRQGNICGLLYGSLNGMHFQRNDRGAGLVTSMDDVIASIAEKAATVTEDGETILAELVCEVQDG